MGKPMFECRLLVRRKWYYYFYNIMLVMGLISFMSFSVIAIPVDEFADRAGITLTLLLTGVAFKFIVGGKVPAVPYITILEKYINWNIFFLIAIFVENFLTAIIKQGDHWWGYYNVGMAIAGVFWLFGHAFFILMCWAHTVAVRARCGERH